MKDTLAELQSLTAARAKVQEKSHSATVLFSDMTDSTRYKELRDEVTALAKTYVHNRVATDSIIRHGGEVVKYVGDEAMGLFEGGGDAASAALCAIEILQTLNEYNTRQALLGDEVLRAKIGVHSGTVRYFKFPGHEPEDPQGLTVDIAARLTSLAKPDQILVTSATRSRVPEDTEGMSMLDGPVARELRGLTKPVDIYEVVWDGNKRGVAETVHFSEDSADMLASLSYAYEAEIRGKSDEAIRHLENVLRRDPIHFRANLALAQLHLRHTQLFEKAAHHATTATQSNPLSARAKHVNCIIPWHLREKDMTNEELDSLILMEERVLQEAHSILDYDLEFIARNTLAYYLAMRFQRRRDVKDREKALVHCEFLAYRADWLSRYVVSAFYDTYATVLSCHDDEVDRLEQALELARKAAEAFPNLPYPHELIAQIQRRLQALRRR